MRVFGIPAKTDPVTHLSRESIFSQFFDSQLISVIRFNFVLSSRA